MNIFISFILLLCIGNAIGANEFDPAVDRFPPSPDWTGTTVFNQPIIKWVYHHLNLFKISSYSRSDFQGSAYSRLIAGTARSTIILWDCIFDAYIAAKNKNWRTISGVNYPPNNLNTANTNKALAFAAYTASRYNFDFLGPDFTTYLNNALVAQGYNLADVNNNSSSTASGLGVLACQNVLNNRYVNDASNFRGDHPLTDNPGQAYSDYTNYRTQPPFPTIGHTNCDTLEYIDSWQPARVKTATGSLVLPWTDHVIHLIPSLVMPCNNFFRPGPPVRNNTATTRAAWRVRNEIMVNRSAALGDFNKAIANYWQDGEGFGGSLWARFAATASEMAGLSLAQTIKLNHLIAHAQMEGYIVQYEGKRFYNPPRPTTPIQCQYRNTPIQSWKGPYEGVGSINGSDWTAYLPITFVQNPNPEYPCGHCSHSGSVGAAFKKFFGSDTFIGVPRTYPIGKFYQEPKITNTSDSRFIAGRSNVANTGPNSVGYAPAAPVTLTWNTWTEVTSQASLSRTYLGVHFDDSHQISYANGRKVGEFTYENIKTLYWKNDLN